MRLLIPMATLMLAGCAVARTSIDRNLLAIPDGKGIVVFSTGAEETSVAAAIGLRLVTRGASTLGPSPSSDTDIVVDGATQSSAFSDEHGRVRMLVLDEGEYCFRPSLLNPYMKLAGSVPDVAFRVRQGSVSYIGSIFMARGRIFQVRDRQQRDVPIFLAGNPSLKPERVTSAPAVIVRDCGAGR